MSIDRTILALKCQNKRKREENPTKKKCLMIKLSICRSFITVVSRKLENPSSIIRRNRKITSGIPQIPKQSQINLLHQNSINTSPLLNILLTINPLEKAYVYIWA
jgi:hypothetical protein